MESGIRFETTRVRPRRLSQHAGAVQAEVLGELRSLAAPLAGARVLHLSAGPFGGAVAESLAALVPLQRDLGLLADWWVLHDDTSRGLNGFYEAIAGRQAAWSRRSSAAWHDRMKRAAQEIPRGYDVIVAHDPQVVGLAESLPPSAGHPRWVWHCHLDTRLAHPEAWADLKRALGPFTAALFPAPHLVPQDVGVHLRDVARPAIDPLTQRNLGLAPEMVALLLSRFGLDAGRPVAGQFAPIDHRYSPMGALGAYWLARQKVPGLQLVLVDPWTVPAWRRPSALEEITKAVGGDPDIHILRMEDGLGATEVSALQHGVAVALQLGVPSGFGWGVAECQWKGKPVVVGRHGLLPEQAGGGACGFIAENTIDAADALALLLESPVLAAELGGRGREEIRRHHLITGLLGSYLRVLGRIGAGEAGRGAQEVVPQRRGEPWVGALGGHGISLHEPPSRRLEPVLWRENGGGEPWCSFVMSRWAKGTSSFCQRVKGSNDGSLERGLRTLSCGARRRAMMSLPKERSWSSGPVSKNLGSKRV